MSEVSEEAAKPEAEGQTATDGTAPSTPEQETKPERTFTQAELDEIVQKRLNKAYRRNEEIRREAEMLRKLALERDQPTKPEETAKPAAEPKREQFDSYEDYIDARAEYRARAAVEESLRQATAREAQESQHDEQKRLAAEWEKRLAAGRKKYDDFDEVAGRDDIHITRAMSMAIMESDIGDELAYFLGKNPDRAAKMAQMSPLAAAREIGKLEAELSAKPAPTRKVSSAPAPISPVGGSEPPAPLSDKLPPDQWRAQFNKRFYAFRDGR